MMFRPFASVPVRPPSGPSDSSNNKAVLEDVVKAIDAVARPNGPPLSSATPTAPVMVASTPASASLAPPATVTPGSTKKPSDSNGSTTAAAAVASETNAVARLSRSPPAAPVGAAASDRAVEVSNGNTSSAGAGASAGVVQPSGARKDVLAAAAEVNGVGEDSGKTARLSGGVRQAVVAAAAEPQAVGTVGTEQNSREVEAVAVEQGMPPATMAEVSFFRNTGNGVGCRCGVQRKCTRSVWRILPSFATGKVMSAVSLNVPYGR